MMGFDILMVQFKVLLFLICIVIVCDAGNDAMDAKAVKLPGFDGTRAGFHTWWMRFMAYAMFYKFSQAVGKSADPKLPGSEAAATTDDHKAAVKANSLAMYSFTMTFQKEGLLGMIYKSRCQDWPSGQAWKVVKALFKKYAPDDIMTHIELEHQLKNVRFKHKKEDPGEMFERIATIENQYEHTSVNLDDSRILATIFEQVPAEYKAIALAEQRRAGSALTRDDLEDVMHDYWRFTYGTIKNDGSSGDSTGIKEITMGATQTGPATNKTCFICKEKGHIAKFCPNKKRSGSGGGGGGGGNPGDNPDRNATCGFCNKKGHTDDKCWIKHEHLQPEWFKKQQERKKATKSGELGAVAAGSSTKSSGGGYEIVICAPTVQQFPASLELLNDPNVFIADSASSLHMTSHPEGMTNMKLVTTNSLCADGKMAEAVAEGKLAGMMCNNQGEALQRLVMAKMKVVPSCPFNVISTSKLQDEGWEVYGNKDYLSYRKNGFEIRFDIKIHTDEGLVYAMYLQRDQGQEMSLNANGQPELGAPAVAEKKISIQQAHNKFGHMSETLTRQAAKANGYTITRGTLGPCEDCSVAKAKQKNLGHGNEDDKVPEKAEDRMFLDCATVKTKAGKKPTKSVWRLMVKQRTGRKFTDFFKSKDAMAEPTAEKLHEMKQEGNMPKYMRMDNAGENKLLHQRMKSKDWKLGIKTEWTARNTPQQNHLAEIGFTTITGRATSMMAAANVPEDKRHLMFPKAATTATKLDGLIPVEIDGTTATRYEHDVGSNPEWSDYLRVWGEAGTVTLKNKMHPKGKDKGSVCMFVGYPDDHAGDCYSMYNPKTGGIHDTRDIIWPRRMYYPKLNVAIEAGKGDSDDDSFAGNMEINRGSDDNDADTNSGDEEDDEDEFSDAQESESEEASNHSSDDSSVGLNPLTSSRSNNAVTRSGRTSRFGPRFDEMSLMNLMNTETFYEANECLLDDLEALQGNDSMEIYDRRVASELCFVGAGIGGGFTNTQEPHVMKYDEAMASKDRVHWEEAVDKEHGKMETNTVFEVTPIEDVPDGATVLTSTWAMKKKADGTYRARVNARGYEQIDGEHFDEHDKAAPVVCDITIRIILVLILMASWAAELLDVRGAFLHGMFKPQHKMYMKVPKGFEKYYPPNCVLLLLKTLYGTRQAALQFWRVLCAAMKHMDYQRSIADACLYYVWTANGLIVWLSWVDDCLVAGPPSEVKNGKQGLMSKFDCDEIGPLKEYVGCKIDWNKDEGSMKLTQPVILQSYNDEFDLPKTAPKYPAPGGEIMMRGEPEEFVEGTMQTKFRKAAGKVLHMMRWSRPDILNRGREFSRYMAGATMRQFTSLLGMLAYLWTTPERGLFLKPSRKWDGKDKSFKFRIRGQSDSDYAKDMETRRSVSGKAVYLEDAPISMGSKMQQCVTLSVTEAELVAGVDCAQDMVFAKEVLESMGLQVELPMVLEIDNKGAVDLANNWSSAGRTRHVASRVMWMREMKEKGILLVKWTPNSNMGSDIFTKNVAGADFDKHVKNFVGEDKYNTK